MTKIAKTENGKEIQIKPEGYGSLLKISFKSGGKLPSELRGEFTSYREAETAVAGYLANKKTNSGK